MTKIITVTLHPAIDKVVELTPQPAADAEPKKSVYSYPAGKGINVSRALACMGIPSIAMGVIGEKDKDFFDTLGNEYITTDWVTTKTATRVNVTTYDTSNGTAQHERQRVETDEPFPTRQIASKLRDCCEKDDLVVISGSVPPKAPVKILYNLCIVCQDKGARVIIDSAGAAMERALKAQPYGIRENQEEFEELTGFFPKTDLEWMKALGKLYDRCYSKYILVSRGAEGAMMYSHITDMMYKGYIELDEPGLTLHTVGSGDAMTAGCCAALLESEKDPEKLLKKALAAGTANLFSPIPGQLEAKKMEELAKQSHLFRN